MPIFRKRSKKSDAGQRPAEFHPEHEFRVVDHEILIGFSVPLPSDGADEVLTDLLKHHAIEIIKDRKERGQPLDGIPVARVSGLRGGEPHEIAVIVAAQSQLMLLCHAHGRNITNTDGGSPIDLGRRC